MNEEYPIKDYIAKKEANEAGMTLKDYMQKNNLMPDPNSPAVKMIMNLHKPISNR